MTDRSTISNQEPEPQAPDSATAEAEAKAEAEAEAEARDLSMGNTPLEWYEAERQSPQDPERAGDRIVTKPPVTVNPRKANATALFLSGVVAMLVTGSAWAAAEILGLFESPWLTVPAGMLIALVVRAGCGRGDAEGRATVAAITYLITLLIVLGVLTRREIYEIYGDATDVLILEENLFRRRFSRVDQLVAYVIGWATTWFGSIWLRH